MTKDENVTGCPDCGCFIPKDAECDCRLTCRICGGKLEGNEGHYFPTAVCATCEKNAIDCTM